MAKLRPFQAVRPGPDKVHLVASRSYVSYSPAKLKDKLEYNPYSFIHIINPEFGHKGKTRPNTRKRFRKVRAEYDRFLREGILFREESPCFYLYRQIHSDHVHTGLIAGISTEEYSSGHIRVHEHTLAKRERVFEEYLDETNFNAEPVLLTFSDSENFQVLIENILQQIPIYDFSTPDRARHQVWAINDVLHTDRIIHFFSAVDNLYIADGHHRSASSALLARERGVSGTEDPAAYFMAFLVPSSDLRISPYHRLITDLGPLGREGFLSKLQKRFKVTACGKSIPTLQRRAFGLYLGKDWFEIDLENSGAADKDTDAQVLTDFILDPVLGITDLRHDPRIAFLGGADKLSELKSLVDRGFYQAALALSPVSVTELMSLSDRGEVMPPKSTWIEPKLRSGLTIYELDR